MNFHKMHALGNDFCIFGSPIDKTLPDKELIKRICDRRYGVGCDCAVFIGKSDFSDYFMHVYNPDGFEAEICGNALRCSVKYVCDNGYFKKRNFYVQTNSGIKKAIFAKDGIITEIGKADVIESSFLCIAGVNIPYVSVSLGNPHCVVFVKSLSDEDFLMLGKAIENHPRFPNGTNVEFARVIDENTIEMRVWERGIGETFSCTTGSCACVAALNLIEGKLLNRSVVQHGGNLLIEVDDTETMSVTGNCTTIFKGTLLNSGG